MWEQLFGLLGLVLTLACTLAELAAKIAVFVVGLAPVHVYAGGFAVVLLLCGMRPPLALVVMLGPPAYAAVGVAIAIGAVVVFGWLFIAVAFLLAWVPHTLLLLPAFWALDGSWLPYGGWAYLQHTLVLLVPLAWAVAAGELSRPSPSERDSEDRRWTAWPPASGRKESPAGPSPTLPPTTLPTTWSPGRGARPPVLPSIQLKPAMRPGGRAAGSGPVAPSPSMPVKVPWGDVVQNLRNYKPKSPRGGRGGGPCGDDSSSEAPDSRS